jgi:ParB/RepB/Spo0J family partition protein
MKEKLEKMKVDDLRKEASHFGVKNYVKMGKDELIKSILEIYNKCNRVSFVWIGENKKGIEISRNEREAKIKSDDGFNYTIKNYDVKPIVKEIENNQLPTDSENIFTDSKGKEIKLGQRVKASINDKYKQGEIVEFKILSEEEYCKVKLDDEPLVKLIHTADITGLDFIKTPINIKEDKKLREDFPANIEGSKEFSEANKQNKSSINQTQRKDLLLIDPDLIKIESGFNTRLDYGDIEELKNSIIENGVRVPLRGYKEGDIYIITDGHRRLVATMKARKEGFNIARVPFLSEKKRTLEERILDIILSNDGKSLTPLELGETYKKLIQFGFNCTEISKKIGKTIKHVSDMISVAESSKELKEIIKDDGISATLVAEIKSKIKDDEKAEEIIKTVHSIKKETGTGKVTKKDIEDLLPEQKKSVFTLEEVKDLLKKQIELCSKGLNKENKEKVLSTKLIIE